MGSLHKLGMWAICAAAVGSAVGVGQEAGPRASGTVLLLANERALEGEITKVGEQYRIRRGASETVIAAQRAKRLCADWDEALAYVRSQANLKDADERLRLARWCQLHGLRQAALVEARSAVEMRPGHPESQKLLELLQRAAEAPAPAIAVAAPAAKPQAPPAQLDLSTDTVALFTNKVQPILMNTCAQCHGGDDAGAFRLHRSFDQGARAATQRNLATAVAYLNLDQPAASPLLVKAVSAHGAIAQPPLRDRRVPAFQTLQQWAEQLAANNPHLRQAKPGPAVNAGPATVAVSAPVNAVPASKPEVVSRVVSRPEEKPVPPPSSGTLPPINEKTPAAPSANRVPGLERLVPPALVNPSDPFDPEIFNRQK